MTIESKEYDSDANLEVPDEHVGDVKEISDDKRVTREILEVNINIILPHLPIGRRGQEET